MSLCARFMRVHCARQVLILNLGLQLAATALQDLQTWTVIHRQSANHAQLDILAQLVRRCVRHAQREQQTMTLTRQLAVLRAQPASLHPRDPRFALTVQAARPILTVIHPQLAPRASQGFIHQKVRPLARPAMLEKLTWTRPRQQRAHRALLVISQAPQPRAAFSARLDDMRMPWGQARASTAVLENFWNRLATMHPVPALIASREHTSASLAATNPQTASSA